MDSFEINKILGAVLGTCLFLLAVHIASGAIFPSPLAKKPGYEIAVKEEQPEQKGGEAPKAPEEQPIEKLLATASADHGSEIAKICQTCHNLQKGGGTKVGPDLYGVVGRPRASEAGFNYSAAMKAKGGSWTFEELNKFLTNPRGYIPGTLMTFAGLSHENQRADVIAYLNTLSDHPLPLPQAAQKEGSQAGPSGGQAAASGKEAAPAKAH